jgi:hypothetical protein
MKSKTEGPISEQTTEHWDIATLAVKSPLAPLCQRGGQNAPFRKGGRAERGGILVGTVGEGLHPGRHNIHERARRETLGKTSARSEGGRWFSSKCVVKKKARKDSSSGL